jgi:hypothetical protein
MGDRGNTDGKTEMRHREAADIALDMISKCGYDVDDYAVAQTPLRSIDPDVLWKSWTNDPKHAGDRRSALISLLGESACLKLLPSS